MIRPNRVKVGSSPAAKRLSSDRPGRAGSATTVGLSYRASLKTADAIMLYAERLFEAAKGDMAVLLVIDSLRKSTDVVRSAGFRKLATGKLARELAGLDKDV